MVVAVIFIHQLKCTRILWQDIFQQNIGRTGPPFPGSPLSKAPLSASQNSGRPPGKKKGPKSKEMVGSLPLTGTKKQSQKSLLKAEAGELDLIEIHTKHTLKKFNPGKSKSRSKVWQLWYWKDLFLGEYVSLICSVSSIFQLDMPLDELGGKLNKSKLKLVLTNGKIQGYIQQLVFHVLFVRRFWYSPAALLAIVRRMEAVTVQDVPEITNIILWRDPVYRT